MADRAAQDEAADRCLRTIDALAVEAGLGPSSAVLLDFESAPVVIVRDATGGSRLIVGTSRAVPAQLFLNARRLVRRSTQEVMPEVAAVEAGDLEVAHAHLEPEGQVVTARVELVRGGRRVVATSIGRNAAERRLYLMAEAAARAVTEFLPPGYGAILGEIRPVPGELGDTLKAAVLFLTPTEDHPLEGTAPIEGSLETAAARTVLAAVQEHVKPLLA